MRKRTALFSHAIFAHFPITPLYRQIFDKMKMMVKSRSLVPLELVTLIRGLRRWHSYKKGWAENTVRFLPNP